jgi:stage III sporulation protein AH
MVLKKQTVWLLSMLTIMVVLSAYYLIQGPVQQVPVAGKAKTDQSVKVDSKQVASDNGKALQSETAATGDDYFMGTKMKRDAYNSQKMDEYMAVMTNDKASSADIAKAKEEYDKLASLQDTEMNVESLIKALGYNEAVVTSKEDRVNVIVEANKLDADNAVKIISLISKHMNVPGKNIVVSYKQ